MKTLTSEQIEEIQIALVASKYTHMLIVDLPHYLCVSDDYFNYCDDTGAYKTRVGEDYYYDNLHMDRGTFLLFVLAAEGEL